MSTEDRIAERYLGISGEIKISQKKQKVYEKLRMRRLIVMPYVGGKWRLVDKKGNVYEVGTRKEIESHIDKMVEKGSYILKS